MEEQASWKGHTFTLMIFGGIVVLCSIFFVLGMLVGRTQGQKLATVAATDAAAKNAAKGQAKDERPELTFYESVDKKKQPSLETVPAKPEPEVAPLTKAVPTPPSAPAPKPVPDPPAPPPPAHMVNFQIEALGTAAAASKLMDKLKQQGFQAFMLTPAAGDAKPLYRVEVGPFSDPTEAESTKRKLESSGYHPILKQ